MHRNDVRSRSGKVGNVPLGLDNHQVHVDGKLGGLSDSLDNDGTERDVGYEAPIHDVDVNPIGACGGDGANFFVETAEVGGENRRGDANRLRAHEATASIFFSARCRPQRRRRLFEKVPTTFFERANGFCNNTRCRYARTTRDGWKAEAL